MKKLYEHFDELSKTHNYYYNLMNFKKNELLNDSSSLIRNYLTMGNKIGVSIEDHMNIFLQDAERVRHVESIYYFGLLIYNNSNIFSNSIDRFIYDQNRYMIFDSSKEENFEFYWFLICFFHDFGYAIENQDKYKNRLVIENVYKKFIKRPNDNWAFLRSFSKNEHRIREFKVNELRKYLPPELYNNYWDYLWFRIQEHKVIDHGIIGGLLFLEDRISSLYLNSKNDIHSFENIDGDISYVFNDLYWSTDIIRNIFFPIAATIIGHNIWYISPNNQNSSKYSDYNLSNLIRSKCDYSFDDYPILYFFQLIDTIDLYKGLKSDHLSFESIVSEVGIEFSEDGIALDFSSIIDSEVKEKHIKNITSMSEWLPFMVIKSDQIIIIKLL